MESDDDRRFLGVPSWKWSCWSSFVTLVGLAGVVAASLIAVWELSENRQAARVAETLDLLDRWEEGGYLAAFQRLDAKIAMRLASVPQDDLEAARANPIIRDRLYERISLDVLAEAEAEMDFEKLVYFFQRLSICVEARLCAREQTLAFFRGPMRSFSRTFKAEIDMRRAASPDFADGLELAD